MSSAPSVAGSVSSSEWGREYEDEDTWYQFTDVYQSGMDTHLLPTVDTAMSLRMAQYRRTGSRRDEPAARPSMKQRLQVVDVPARPAETGLASAGRVRPALWQLKDIADDEGGDGQGNAPEDVVHDGNGSAMRDVMFEPDITVHEGNSGFSMQNVVKPEVHVPGVPTHGETSNVHECGTLCNTLPDVAMHDRNTVVPLSHILRTESVFRKVCSHVSRLSVYDNVHIDLSQGVSDDITNTILTTRDPGEKSLGVLVGPTNNPSSGVNRALQITKFKGTVPPEICEAFSGSSSVASSFDKTSVSTDQFTFLCLERKNTSHDMFQPQVTCVMYLFEDTTVCDSLSPPPSDIDSNGASVVANGVAPRHETSTTVVPSRQGAALWCKSSGLTTEARRISGLKVAAAKVATASTPAAESRTDINDNTTPVTQPRATSVPRTVSLDNAPEQPKLDRASQQPKFSLIADDVMTKNLKKFPFFAATRRPKSADATEDTARPTRPPVETLAVLLRRGKSECLRSLNLTWLERVRHRGVREAAVWVGVALGAAVGVLFAVLLKVLQAFVANSNLTQEHV